LAKVKFVVSHRGKAGGYKIAVDPKLLSLAQIITALEGRIAVSECNSKASCCSMLKNCPLTSPLAKINRLIYETLDTYKLSDLITKTTVTEQKIKLVSGGLQ
jgi:Rrf2 family protein